MGLQIGLDRHGVEDIIDAVKNLTTAIQSSQAAGEIELEWFKSHLKFATKDDLKELEKNIMSAISEFAAKQKEFNTRQGAAIDGLVGDIKALNDKITELQNSPGTITPEDQALLDELQASAQAATEKLEALDAQTPPVPPANP